MQGGVELEAALGARTVLANAEDEDRRHLVLWDGGQRFRLNVTGSTAGSDFIVRADSTISLRLAALDAFCAGARRRNSSAIGNALRPSAYVRHRLALLLAILDRMEDPDAPAATVRQIAHDLVFPGLAHDRAVEWKSSSRRRQTQRLMAKARHMTTSGYLDLLRGVLRSRPRRSDV
jgi:hypothetical protein